MSEQSIEDQKFAQGIGDVLEWIAETLLLVAFFLLCFKFFWFLVRGFTLSVLDYVLEWSTLWRMLVGFPLIALPVLVAGFLLFGNEERPGWRRLFELRKHRLVAGWLALFRHVAAVVASFAFFKLIWLTGEQGAESIDWWHVFAEFFRQF